MKKACSSRFSIEKDVDGFHPLNIGRLAQKGRDPLFVPCTPAGVHVLLIETVMPDLEGANAVVLGRSNIVGMPVALLLVRANATVTICHSRTRRPARGGAARRMCWWRRSAGPRWCAAIGSNPARW